MSTLVPLSILIGIFTAAMFRRFSAAGVRQTVNRILAHLMELRLFLDEPRLIFQAQRDLVRENLRLLGQIALPTLITVPILAIVLWQADAIYGRAPLPAGVGAVITAHVKSGDLAAIHLNAPPQVIVETPGVRIPRLHEVSWRVRPAQPFTGAFTTNGDVNRIDIPWPRKSWLPWFLVISTLAALISPALLKRYVPLLFLIAFPLCAADKPPVILISIDTLRADHLSAWGYTRIHTPNIDAFADKGTAYTQIDSQVPLTLPSHASLMTSTYPFHNRVEVNGDAVPPGTITLASILRANGYRTAAFIGSMILDRRYGLDQGFDLYDSPFQGSSVRRDAALVIRAARTWLEKDTTQPAFAFLHLYDLHTPYTLPQVAGLTPNIAGYDAELTYVDETLGRFREALIKDGLWDKALIVILADHGESLGDHGETSHGYFVYESTMHVPLIFHWPAGAQSWPARIVEPGGLIDVAPSILDFLHLAIPPSFAGESLLPGHKARNIYGESIYPRQAFGYAALRALRNGSYKYIDAPRPELYDLSKDPNERSNILALHPDEAKTLETSLNQTIARYPPAAANAQPQVSAQAKAALGSLGYTAKGRQSPSKQLIDPKDKIAESEAYESGLTLLYTSHYDQAILKLNRLTTQDSRNLPALCALGEAYLRKGNPTKALALWQQALEKDPNYSPAADSIGEYWLSQKDYEKACRFIPTAPPCHK
jgi:choline-sulfatase